MTLRYIHVKYSMKLHKLHFHFIVHSVVKPAVQLLHIQEVHPGPHTNACNFCRCYPFFHTCSTRSYFPSRTPNTRRATLLLPSHSSPTTRRHPWAPWWTSLCMPSASARKSASRKKWVLRFPWMDSHVKTGKNCMLLNVAPDALPGSATFVRVLDHWLNQLWAIDANWHRACANA